MNVNGTAYTSIWLAPDHSSVGIIDQTLLPHHFSIVQLRTLNDFCTAIQTMQVRGAPLIGATAAFGLAFALREDASRQHEAIAAAALLATRPTAVNLQWAVRRVQQAISQLEPEAKAEAALNQAQSIRAEDVTTCQAIGEHGAQLLRTLQQNSGKPEQPLNILTHCNAGWLATVDWGTALAPIYIAHQSGMKLHVWVDETRPRNQGANLTAWELAQQGIPHTVIADNTGGHLMQNGQVDLCLVGSDRTTASGDVCNKIGTYLKALAAADNKIPFYVALPASTIDWAIDDGIRDIPIELRSPEEITHVTGLADSGDITRVQLGNPGSNAANYAFDVTPARLITGLITEHGLCAAERSNLRSLQQTLTSLSARSPTSTQPQQP